jgi:mono/diheme cytochrome c family protein
VIFWLAAAWAGVPADLELGRRIWETGEGAGAISATLAPGLTVPASTVPCAGCHGWDGEGRREGGLSAPAIAWPATARPYAVPVNGRVVTPAEGWLQAVREGTDGSGNPLQAGMPRYTLSDGDAAALGAWIAGGLGRTLPAGVTPTTVRLGCVLPDDLFGSLIEAALRQRLAQLSAAGLVNGRTVELDVRRAAKQDLVSTLATLVADDPPFALVAPYTRGQEQQMGAAADGVPIVAALAGPRREDSLEMAGTWPVIAREEDLVRVLVDEAAGRGRAALVVEDAPSSFLRAAKAQAALWGTRLRRRAANVVYLGDGAGLVRLRARLPSAVTVYALGSSADQPWPLVDGPVVLAYPTARGPDLRGGHGHGRWSASGVPEEWLDDVQSAVAGLELSFEALAAAGRAVRRDAFTATLGAATGRHGELQHALVGQGAFLVRYDPVTGAGEGRWALPRWGR